MDIWGPNSSWFWTMVQAIVVAVSLFFIYRQVKYQRYTNMLVSLNSLREKWDSELMRRSRLAVSCRFRDKDKSITDDCLYILSFFEELGMHYKKKVFETDVLWSIYSYRVENFWMVLEPMVKEYRAHFDDTYYENFEYLKKQFEAHSRKRNLSVKPKTEAELMVFVRDEIEALEKFPKQLK